MDELRLRNPSQRLYISALSQAWRNATQLYDPSTWLVRDPEAEEKMLRDDAIAHAVGFRRHLIAGRQWDLQPRVESAATAQMAVAVGKVLVESIKHFTTARLNLARAFFSGSRFGRIHGRPRTLTIGDGRPRTWWVPERIEDVDKRVYRIVPRADVKTGIIHAHWERWNIGKGEWEMETVDDGVCTIRHVYQDDQASLGHGRALREALGWAWYAKQHVMQETLAAVEKHAGGTLHAKVNGIRDAATGLPNEELIAQWRDTLEDMRSRHVLVSDAEDEVTILDGNAEGWQLLDKVEDKLRSSIFTLVLGANLTTSADSGGSYALAEIQENSTEALIQYDRETLEETLTDDLLGCIWFKNHCNLVELGISNQKPRFNIIQEKRQDPKERAEVASALSGIGIQLSLDDVLEQTGFRKPEPGEDIVKGAPPPAPSPFGGFGGGGGGFGQPAPQPGQTPPPAPAQPPQVAQP